MKAFIKLVVVVMCLSWLFALFGCTDPFVRDKTGMVRQFPWNEFTVSQSSDVYEENISYTVKKDQENYYLVLEGEYPDFEDEYILLSSKTVDALLAMDLGSFPDLIPEQESQDDEPMILDGSFQTLTVVDENGVRMPKAISYKEFQQITEMLSKYIN